MADRLLAVVKEDCPTCRLVVPALRAVAEHTDLVTYSQDSVGFLEGLPNVHCDEDFERSHRLRVHTVPTLVRESGGVEVGRVEGWHREQWEALTGVGSLGSGLPESQPGCGARNVEPGMPERLALRFGDLELASRRVAVSPLEDPVEVGYDRGWSDGLPVTPPTDVRVARMLNGTRRAPDEVVGLVPPDLASCSVEKVAVNAVLAGCRPEYMPVVLAAVEAALIPEFAMHGLLCTLHSAGPVVIVNGPVSKRIGMNWGGNALGQGNRANATIGRALQLVVRNVGGGRPGEIDRSVFGNPGKLTFCFAEDETDPDWEPLSVHRGFPVGTSTVTLYQGEGPRMVWDQPSRTPEELTRSLAMCLWGVTHPKAPRDAGGGALLVLGPDHHDIYRNAGWGRREVHAGIWEALRRPASEIVRGVDGVPHGVDADLGDTLLDKFYEDSFLIVRAGGRGGSVSAIVGGWSAHRHRADVQPVTKEIIDEPA